MRKFEFLGRRNKYHIRKCGNWWSEEQALETNWGEPTDYDSIKFHNRNYFIREVNTHVCLYFTIDLHTQSLLDIYILDNNRTTRPCVSARLSELFFIQPWNLGNPKIA